MNTLVICSSIRELAVRHFAEGIPWTTEDRDHYFQCVDCIVAVTEQLDQKRIECMASNGYTDANGRKPMSEAARAAIARGRKVLERELGIPADR